MLSIIAANVYPDFAAVEAMLRNLAGQTFQDFELVLIDGYYEENRTLVAELCGVLGIKRVVHTPACEARHVGRRVHWELYSNAMLLASEPWVLHHGVYRHLHQDAVRTVAELANAGICAVLEQKIVNSWDDTIGYPMNSAHEYFPTLSNSGFFSIRADTMAQEFNGHSEALVLHHWVDVDLSLRAVHFPLQVRILRQALLRIEHARGYTSAADRYGRMLCNPIRNPECAAALLGALGTYRRIDIPIDRFQANGWEWVRCPNCGTIGVEDEAGYVAHLEDPAYRKAPINVSGVGRNIARLADDLKGLGISSKIEILKTSHTDKRYLE